jgi:hypothetical protein
MTTKTTTTRRKKRRKRRTTRVENPLPEIISMRMFAVRSSPLVGRQESWHRRRDDGQRKDADLKLKGKERTHLETDLAEEELAELRLTLRETCARLDKK